MRADAPRGERLYLVHRSADGQAASPPSSTAARRCASSCARCSRSGRVSSRSTSSPATRAPIRRAPRWCRCSARKEQNAADRGVGDQPGRRPRRATPRSTDYAGCDPQRALAAKYFTEGSRLDDGDGRKMEEAASAYRKALVVDPDLVPAIVNLANIHYARDEVIEAQALYERAIGLDAGMLRGALQPRQHPPRSRPLSRARWCATARRSRSTRTTPTRTSIWR